MDFAIVLCYNKNDTFEEVKTLLNRQNITREEEVSAVAALSFGTSENPQILNELARLWSEFFRHKTVIITDVSGNITGHSYQRFRVIGQPSFIISVAADSRCWKQVVAACGKEMDPVMRSPVEALLAGVPISDIELLF